MAIKEGDEVLIPNYICGNVAKAVTGVGAKFRLYDNAKTSWVSNFDEIQQKVTKNTKAILINHTFGIRMPDVKKLCKLSIPIIEDCCHALSPEINGVDISKDSLCSFYSFNATKLLATGEGGAVATDNSSFAKALSKVNLDKGLSDLNCALGISQFQKMEFFLKRRKEIAEKYFQAFPESTKKIKNLDSLYFRFPIFVPQVIDSFPKSTLVSFRKGVDALIDENGQFPNTKYVFNYTLSLPIYPALSDDEVEEIIAETKRIYSAT